MLTIKQQAKIWKYAMALRKSQKYTKIEILAKVQLKIATEELKYDEPIPGVQYALTGAKGTPSIANGNTWAESRVQLPQKGA